MHKLFLFFLFLMGFGFSQETETIEPYHIKTVTFVQAGNNVIPFFELGATFQLQFDDLYASEEDYYYTIEQYNYDWTPTQLLKAEYLNGLDNQRILDYRNSVNCLQVYSHYNIAFPNRQTQITKSGNYMIKIWDDEQHLVFSRKFVLYENNTSMGITIRRARSLEFNNHKHNIEFFLDYKNAPLQNPLQTLKVSIFQNGKWTNAIHNVKPQYTLGSQLIFRYDKETQFWAGNEFLNFENKNIRGANNNVASVSSGKDMYNTELYPNYERKKQPYTFFPDINGNFFVNNISADNQEIEADYAWVYFTLNANVDPLKNDVYVHGMFNHYNLADEYKMEYNASKKVFEKAILMKQGFTNYQYTLTDKKGKIDEANAVDGNFFQTENEYIVLAYYRGPADRYDRIIGIARNNSTEVRN